MKKRKKILAFAAVFLVLLSSCSLGKGKTEVDIELYEHKVVTAAPMPSPTPTMPPEDLDLDQTEDDSNNEDVQIPSVFEVDGMKFTPVNDTVKVIAGKCNIRSRPTVDSSIAATAKAGDRFTRTGIGDGGWDQLIYQGETVYIKASFLEEVEGSDKAMDSSYLKAASKGSIDMGKLTVVDISNQKYTYEDMREDLKELNEQYPERMQLDSLAVTKDGRNIYEAVIGNPDAAKHIIIQAAIHGREYMTTLLVMKQVEYYLYYEGDGMYGNATYRELFDDVAFHIIPMANPDGVAISQNGLDAIRNIKVKENIKDGYEKALAAKSTELSFSDYLILYKANANGVDLNRNFSYGWEDYVGAKNPASEKYKGAAPVSESESLALAALTEKIMPVATISYHATGSVIYWDYGQTGALRNACSRLVNVINGITGYEIKYALSDKADAAGYGDWCVMELKIPSATIEIGTGTTPLSISEFPTIWNKNEKIWAALAAEYR